MPSIVGRFLLGGPHDVLTKSLPTVTYVVALVSLEVMTPQPTVPGDRDDQQQSTGVFMVSAWRPKIVWWPNTWTLYLELQLTRASAVVCIREKIKSTTE